MLRMFLSLFIVLLLGVGPVSATTEAQPSATGFSLAARQALIDAAKALTKERVPDTLRAAEAGDADAQIVLAIAYEEGRVIDKDPVQAVTWLQKAAALRHPMGLAGLAMHHLDGTGVARDEVRAADLLRDAAEQGFAVAQNNLGVLYARGLGVPKDLARSVFWYRRAAEQGFAQAAINVAEAYDNGWGVRVDHVEAAKWWRAAADTGDADAQFNLAMAYSQGEGVPKSRDDCEAWLQKASDQGHAAASYYIGKLHADHSWVAGAFAQMVADDYFQRSARQGYALGALMLGIRARDRSESYKWLLIARALEQRADWRERWSPNRPWDAEEVRRQLPKRLDSTRKKLSADQIAAAEQDAAQFVAIHRGPSTT